MKANMGNIDKTIRVLIALAVGVLIYTSTITGTFAIVAGILAIIAVLTSIVSFCPFYTLFGMNTCKHKT